MTEVERARDAATVGICSALGKLFTGKGEHSNAKEIWDIANDLEEVSRKQHDADRNGVRRKMGKDDCPEKKDEEEQSATSA